MLCFASRAVIAASFALLNCFAAVPGEIDRSCWTSPAPGSNEQICQILAIHQGVVKFTEPGRTVDIDKYVAAAQSFVPRTEAPIRELRSRQGWHVVVSSFLDHKERFVGLRIRFFGPDLRLRSKADVAGWLEDIESGVLFGGSDEIVAVQSNWEHAYNSETDIWLLPAQGAPRHLLKLNATIGHFSAGSDSRPPGLKLQRQTYDGLNAETKGWVTKFWVWDRAHKSLMLQKK